MTKEEFRQALNDYDYIKECVEDLPCGLDGIELKCDSDELYNILDSLIKEHFDNPPLTYDELKEGMWVWDNKLKKYHLIVGIHKTLDKVLYLRARNDYPYYLDFEPNRFYRKEVRE